MKACFEHVIIHPLSRKTGVKRAAITRIHNKVHMHKLLLRTKCSQASQTKRMYIK